MPRTFDGRDGLSPQPKSRCPTTAVETSFRTDKEWLHLIARHETVPVRVHAGKGIFMSLLLPGDMNGILVEDSTQTAVF